MCFLELRCELFFFVCIKQSGEFYFHCRFYFIAKNKGIKSKILTYLSLSVWDLMGFLGNLKVIKVIKNDFSSSITNVFNL